ncbi:transposase [Rhodococcus globerulus]|uniref:transposase n=1 Tax=Rhodococcus globerulus TaxID=33008 RepID=UPI003AFB52C7
MKWSTSTLRSPNASSRTSAPNVLLTMSGLGTVLAATFLANAGNLDGFDTVDRLAARRRSVARLSTVRRDSGRISGNLHRPFGFNRRLFRT